MRARSHEGYVVGHLLIADLFPEPVTRQIQDSSTKIHNQLGLAGVQLSKAL